MVTGRLWPGNDGSLWSPQTAPPHERGPGLTGEHLNTIAIRAHEQGYQRAREDFERQVEEAMEARATAYDEGYDAATDGMVRDFAHSARGQLLGGAWFPLLAAADGKKVRVNAELAKAKLAEFERWLYAVASGDEPGL